MNNPAVSKAESHALVDKFIDEAIAKAPNEDIREFYRLQRAMNHAYLDWAAEAVHSLGGDGNRIIPIVCEVLACIANIAIGGIPPVRQPGYRLLFAKDFLQHLQSQSIVHGHQVRHHDA